MVYVMSKFVRRVKGLKFGDALRCNLCLRGFHQQHCGILSRRGGTLDVRLILPHSYRSYALFACVLEPSMFVHVVPLCDKRLEYFHKLIHSEKLAALQHPGNILLALAGGAGCRERSGVGLEFAGES